MSTLPYTIKKWLQIRLVVKLITSMEPVIENEVLLKNNINPRSLSSETIYPTTNSGQSSNRSFVKSIKAYKSDFFFRKCLFWFALDYAHKYCGPKIKLQ